MAIISSYPTITPQLADKVLGSNNVDSYGDVVQGNPTVQYSIESVKTLIDQHYIQQLYAFTPDAVTDLGGNIGIPLTFGTAQASDSVTLAANGTITFNKTGSYVIQQIYYAQATSGTSIVLNFQTIKNGDVTDSTEGTQSGATTTTSFLSTSSTARHRVDITSYIDIIAEATYYNFWVQNPSSGGTGNLQPQPVSGAWSTNVPSTQLIITKLV
jgi:hypothetical protein|tara:strand:- start:875 stop:1513 length:639 start_codon:yes stop_codon:yes gene_type:complete